jgi:hypothetical protein
MRDPQTPDPVTISDLKDDLRSIFRQAWMREIEDCKPEREITSEEIIRWTTKVAAKMELAIKALVKEEIEKVAAESS